MKEQLYYMPPPEVDQRLLANLRRTQLEMDELGEKLSEIITKLEQNQRKTRQKRLLSSI